MTKKKVETNLVWQNRITGYGEKPAKDFKLNPGNWRVHGASQRSALSGILSEVGWVTGVIENARTGNLIDGHARVEEALAAGADTLVPFTKVDLSEEEERKILAVLDPIGAMATTDGEKLSGLLSSLEFETTALDEMLRRNRITDVELNDFFEEKQIDIITEKYSITLEYAEKEVYAAVMDGLNKTASTPSDAVRTLLDL